MLERVANSQVVATTLDPTKKTQALDQGLCSYARIDVSSLGKQVRRSASIANFPPAIQGV